jgi:hypothetical protein
VNSSCSPRGPHLPKSRLSIWLLVKTSLPRTSKLRFRRPTLATTRQGEQARAKAAKGRWRGGRQAAAAVSRQPRGLEPPSGPHLPKSRLSIWLLVKTSLPRTSKLRFRRPTSSGRTGSGEGSEGALARWKTGGGGGVTTTSRAFLASSQAPSAANDATPQTPARAPPVVPRPPVRAAQARRELDSRQG